MKNIMIVLGKLKDPKNLGRLGIFIFLTVWTVTGSMSNTDGIHLPFVVFAITVLSLYLIYRYVISGGEQ